MAIEKTNKVKGTDDISRDVSLSRMYIKYGLIVLKASALAIIITVVLLLISAVVLLLTGIDDGVSPYIVQVIRIASICIAGLICGKTVSKMGWLAGMASGLCYVLITILMGLIFFGGVSFDGDLLCNVIIALIAGLASGIAGINTAKKKNKERRYFSK